MRLNVFIIFIVSIGLSMTPTHTPFTIIFVDELNIFGLHSCRIRIVVLARNHFIIGKEEYPFVTTVLIDMCLCNPIFPPSGVSTGSIYPH